MDVDVFVAAHRAEWDRLERLLDRSGRLSGAEADELVTLYQRTATHLSAVRSAAPDPVLVGRLSALVARGRAVVSGVHTPAWREVVLFLTRRLPAALYRTRWWWTVTGAAFLAVCVLTGAWVAGDETVQAQLLPPAEVDALTRPGGDFEGYYRDPAAASFAGQVFTNNVFVSVQALALGILILPTVYVLWMNALNTGVIAGYMAEADRLDVFFGMITPHGLPELTAVFVAAGTGMRLGWTLIDPGPRPRGRALAEEGRVSAAIALGLVVLLAVCGAIEGFVTPSSLPTWARIGVGVVAEALFLGYALVLGRRATRAGETGDVDPDDAEDRLPTSG